MTKETQRIVGFFVVIFAACSFGTFIVSYLGNIWYSCRAPETKQREVDMTISLWRYCMKKKNTNEFICHKLDDSAKFQHVVADFHIMRGLAITTIIFAGSAFLLALLHCFFPTRKFTRKLVLLQTICACMTVMFGISNLLYTTLRGQDVVGKDMKFTFGWSCVIGWIGTIVGFLNVIMTVVLMCIYLDSLRERVIRVREELNMDDISISSNDLRRMANDTEEINNMTSNENDNETVVNTDTLQNEININLPNTLIDTLGRTNEGYNDDKPPLCSIHSPNDGSNIPSNIYNLSSDSRDLPYNRTDQINVINDQKNITIDSSSSGIETENSTSKNIIPNSNSSILNDSQGSNDNILTKEQSTIGLVVIKVRDNDYDNTENRQQEINTIDETMKQNTKKIL